MVDSPETPAEQPPLLGWGSLRRALWRGLAASVFYPLAALLLVVLPMSGFLPAGRILLHFWFVGLLLMPIAWLQQTAAARPFPAGWVVCCLLAFAIVFLGQYFAWRQANYTFTLLEGGGLQAAALGDPGILSRNPTLGSILLLVPALGAALAVFVLLRVPERLRWKVAVPAGVIIALAVAPGVTPQLASIHPLVYGFGVVAMWIPLLAFALGDALETRLSGSP